MLFDEKLETKISTSSKNWAVFVREKADLFQQVASIMSRTLESYLDSATSDVANCTKLQPLKPP